MSIAVRERPILFSGPMIRALLAGQKTQTRRAVKWKPLEEGLNLSFSGLSVNYYCPDFLESGFVLLSRRGDGCWEQRTKPLCCPYGNPGDRLWVRETFVTGYEYDGSRDTLIMEDENGDELPETVWYRATESDEFGWLDEDGYTTERVPWKPSIFMPRWASRITLEITGVRVERLQQITEEDAIAEGMQRANIATDVWLGDERPSGAVPAGESAREVFAETWDNLNAERGFPWSDSPWVWVIEFRVLEITR